MTSKLAQLKKITTIVADTGDLDAIRRYQPQDATTNPSLLLKAAQMPSYKQLVTSVINEIKSLNIPSNEQMSYCMDSLAVKFGGEIIALIPGRVSTEVDARLSFDTNASITKAQQLIELYNTSGIDPDRVLIKLASTWEGIRAAEALEKQGINTNLTLLFNFTQAAAAADAGAFLISPFVGRILDWHLANGKNTNFAPQDDPGVQSVTRIFNYYKQWDYQTVVMGASFRNTDQILQLAGCDKLTISPVLLEELSNDYGELERKLDPSETGEIIDFVSGGETNFRYLVNEDAMATEKLAEGIRNFVADQLKLENWLKGF